MDIDPLKLALRKSSAPVTTKPIKNPIQPRSDYPKIIIEGKFLKGPISLTWIQAASQLPGKSLQVAVAIRFLVGLKKSGTVKLSQTLLNEFGVTRYSKYRALASLSEAGLISVQSANGKNPVVTVMEISGGQT